MHKHSGWTRHLMGVVVAGMIVLIAGAAFPVGWVTIATFGQAIPEPCLMCYKGEVDGIEVHVFDDWLEGAEPVYNATNEIHPYEAYAGDCTGWEAGHPHQCCDPE